MAISKEQHESAIRGLRKCRLQLNPGRSEAADWWDKLSPEWRGVVLHAAAVNSGAGIFKAHLSNCCWAELFERLDYRAMIQLRQGISRARLTLEGFGSLRDSDFSRRTAKRPEVKKVHVGRGVKMVIAPEILYAIEQREKLKEL